MVISPLYCQSFSDDTYEEVIKLINEQPSEYTNQKLDSLLKIKVFSSFDKGRKLLLKGIFNSHNHNYDTSIIMYLKALSLFKDNYKWEVKSRLNLSTVYCDKEQYTKATTQLLKVKEIANKKSDLVLLAEAQEYFSYIYFKQGDKTMALNQLEKSIETYEKLKDTIVLSRLYNNLAVIYQKNTLYRKASRFNNKALLLSENLNDQLAISQSYNNLARNYEGLYNQTDSILHFEKAILYYKKSAKIKRLYPNNWNSALENLARIYTSIGKHDLANSYYIEISNNNYNKEQYKKMENISRQQMMEAFSKKNITKAHYYALQLDSVQKKIHKAKTLDFKQMLKNQEELFESKKNQNEKELRLEQEHNKRLKSEGLHYRFKVILFSILAILLLAILLFIQYHKKTLLKTEKERERLKLTILRSQMNPHFISNVLTAIQNTVLDNTPLKTASYISRFSKLIRENFNFTNKETIKLSDDISSLINYLEMQKVRFGDKLNYDVHIAKEIKQKKTLIPPMLLQPLIENAIEHGLKNKNKGFVQISIQQTNKQIHFIVDDNGVGYTPVNNDGKEHALDILRARLTLRGYGEEKTFFIKKTNAKEGTQVGFSLRLSNYV